jgi:alpha-1,2-mannosyltransferase
LKAEARSVPRAAWVAASVLGAVGLVVLAYYVRHTAASGNWLFSGHFALGFLDLHSRFRDVHKVMRGINIYSKFDHHQYFTYPPAALLIFWPLSWFKVRTDVLWWTLFSEVALAATIAMCWRRVRASDPWMIAAGSMFGAIAAIVVFPPLSIHLALGQLGLFIALLVGVDYLVLATPNRLRGVATGVATAIKIYPVVFIVAYALRREWRAVATSVGSALATALIALALWPSLTVAFVRRQVLSGRELTHFLHNAHYLASSSSPFTIFFRWPFSGGPLAHVLGWAASLGAVALGLWAATRLYSRGRVASSFVMVLAASALAGPVTWDHYYVFAPLVVFVIIENLDLVAIAVTAGVAIACYAVPWQLMRNDSLSVNSLSARALGIFVARNALSAATIAMFIAVVVATRSARRERVEQLSSPAP